MKSPTFNDLTDALSAPVGDLIASIGLNMADAQQALDASTIENFKTIYSNDGEVYEALRKIGYQPTWYQIPEVNAEVNMSLTVSGVSEESGAKKGLPNGSRKPGKKRRIQLYATPVDATFTNKYDFNYSASSKISFKIVPIPPSAAAEGIKVVPNLIGKKYSDAELIMDELNIDFSIAGNAATPPKPVQKVTAQSIPAGEIMRMTETLELTVR